MKRYVRPLVQVGAARTPQALTLAGGWAWFDHVEILSRSAPPYVESVAALHSDEAAELTRARPTIAGLAFDAPIVMGILNVTPDSFSDGGKNNEAENAVATASAMVKDGAQLIDIGGESTRPGADFVPVDQEILRTAPVVKALRAAGVQTPISIDTRKAPVAGAALEAGAQVVNDVSGFTFDAALAPLCAAHGAPICVMHAQGDPTTMQDNPFYEDVLLDVYDFLHAQIAYLIAQGIPKSRIIADPGIGFGKTMEHNLALLARISLFHSLGVPILLGASRKRFIGTIAKIPQADQRGAGSVGVGLAALGQGIQILRAHDVAQHCQAIALWRAAHCTFT